MTININEMIKKGMSYDEILKTVTKEAEKNIAEVQAKNTDLAKKSKARTALINAAREYATTNLDFSPIVVDRYLGVDLLNKVLTEAEADKDIKDAVNTLNTLVPKTPLTKKKYSSDFDGISMLLKDIL